ncbi:hypothetical protein BU17DRAFT_93485 [Hysterangium stoloniferum]|nr:hypothetical protein BU17DRAFT_93485 [Hysterangium stoloniferum]
MPSAPIITTDEAATRPSKVSYTIETILPMVKDALKPKYPVKEDKNERPTPHPFVEPSQQTCQTKDIEATPMTVSTFGGVQLLSRALHSQIFDNVAFPAPEDAYIQIARVHFVKHQLHPSASSTHPDVSFTLPPLQGPTIDAHFHALGAQITHPYLSMSQRLASLQLPPQPDSWAVECPDEELLVFDVETLPNYSPFAIMACAASPTAWYAWISWHLNERTDPEQLVPLGDPRIVVGHNISYDRAHTLEEYRLEHPGTRWLDTMTLHIAVNGISSHQRPAWSQYRKRKLANCTMRDEAVESEKRRELKQQAADLSKSSPPEAIHEVGGEEERDSSESAKKRWEDSTAVDSLAGVACLHSILADLSFSPTYCASDVAVTHEVFRKTLAAFLERCPNPVSFAGMCSMGSSFFPVNETWEEYLRLVDEQYHTLDHKVVIALRKLVDEARQPYPPSLLASWIMGMIVGRATSGWSSQTGP